jgi:hypothetical protein
MADIIEWEFIHIFLVSVLGDRAVENRALEA